MSEKGKPPERAGRKTTGLSLFVRYGSGVAGRVSISDVDNARFQHQNMRCWMSLTETHLADFCQCATRYVTGKIRREADDNVYRRVIFLYTVSLIGIVTLTILGVVALFEGNFLLSLFDAVVAVILSLNLYIFHQTGDYLLACQFGISLVGLFFIWLLFTGGIKNTAFVWYYTFPLFACFLLGSRKGAIATFLIMLPALVFFLIDSQSPLLAAYQTDFKIRFIPSFLIVFLYAYVYEKLREKKQYELERKNEGLEDRVIQRTTELKAANEQLNKEAKIRKQTEQKVDQAHKRLLAVLDNLHAVVHVADMESHEVIFMNKYAKKIFGEGEGAKCWQIFQAGQDGPCAFCSNPKLIDEDREPIGPYLWELQNTANGCWYDIRDCAIHWDAERLVRIHIALDITERKKGEEERQRLIDELHQALIEIKTLKGILPICSFCKNIRDDQGYWSQVDDYISKHSAAKFSHGVCPDCLKKHYPKFTKTFD
jgi:PAS domain-containing protein